MRFTLSLERRLACMSEAEGPLSQLRDSSLGADQWVSCCVTLPTCTETHAHAKRLQQRIRLGRYREPTAAGGKSLCLQRRTAKCCRAGSQRKWMIQARGPLPRKSPQPSFVPRATVLRSRCSRFCSNAKRKPAALPPDPLPYVHIPLLFEQLRTHSLSNA